MLHGTTLHYAGVPWFGQGVLSGKRYEMQLAAMTDMRLVHKHTIGQGGEPQAGTRVTTHAGEGNERSCPPSLRLMLNAQEESWHTDEGIVPRQYL